MATNVDAPHGELIDSDLEAGEPSGSDSPNVDVDSAAVDYDEAVVDGREDAGRKGRRPEVRRAIAAGLVGVVVLGGLVGWTGYQTYQAHRLTDQRELFLQVGRQGALNLTTIDWQHADADVQRILDSSTGSFHEDFASRSGPFLDVLKQAQSTTVGSITESGLESDDANGAEVLVSVRVDTKSATAPEQKPRSWRMRVTVAKDGDQAKVSNVEFVP